jgi:hypothetical protein
MNDHISREYLLDYLEGALPVHEQSLVQQHIGGCHDCRSRLAMYWRMDGKLSRALPQIAENITLDSAHWIEMEASFDALSQVNGHRVVASLAERRKETERLSLFKRFSPMMMFTQALLIIGFSAFLAFILFRPTQQGNEGEVTAVPDGTQESLTPEPTPVSLTPLEYPYQLGPITLRNEMTQAQIMSAMTEAQVTSAMTQAQITSEMPQAELTATHSTQAVGSFSSFLSRPPWLNTYLSPSIAPLTEVSTEFGTPALTLTELPSGYSLTARYFSDVDGSASAYVSTSYTTFGMGQTLLLDQLRYGDGYYEEYSVGGAALYSVQVRGVQGVYIEGAEVGVIPSTMIYDEATGTWSQAANDPASPDTMRVWTFNMLMWEENGTLVRLMGDHLNAADLLTLAESLTTDALPPKVQSLCVAGADQQVFANPDEYYCLIYPEDFELLFTGGRAQIARKVTAGIELTAPYVIIARLYAHGNEGDALDAIIQGELVKDISAPEPVELHELTIGGNRGAVLEPKFRDDGTVERVLFVEYGTFIYRLRFGSADSSNADTYAEMEALYDLIVSSFTPFDFDPVPTSGPTPTPTQNYGATMTPSPTGLQGEATPTSTATATVTPDAILCTGSAPFSPDEDLYALQIPCHWEDDVINDPYSVMFHNTLDQSREPDDLLWFYVNIHPVGMSFPDASVYNYMEEAFLDDIWEMVVGDQISERPVDDDNAKYFTFTRLPDQTIDGYPAAVIENTQPWEFSEDVNDRRYILLVDSTWYIIGGYYNTPDGLALLEEVVDTFYLAQ